MHSLDDLLEISTAPIPPAQRERLSEGLKAELDRVWHSTLNRELLSAGRSKINVEELLAAGTPIRISEAVSQLRRVRASAVELFENEAGPVCRLSFGDAQKKHFVSRMLSRDAILTRSRNGVSLFYNGITPADLELVLFDLLEQRLDQIVGQRRVRVDVDALCAVGASFGAETDMIRFDLSIAAGDAHAFPIRRVDADPNLTDPDLMYCSSDLLQGVVTSR